MVQAVYVAQHNHQAIIVLGYLTGDDANRESNDAICRRTLLTGIRDHWGLLRKQVAA